MNNNETETVKWECISCEEEIEHLSYNVNTSSTEYGNAYLTTPEDIEPLTRSSSNTRDCIDSHEESDSNDPEWSSEPIYTCPECDYEYDENEKPKIIITKKINKIKEPTNEEENHDIITPIHQSLIQNNQSGATLQTVMLCKKCKYTYVGGAIGEHQQYQSRQYADQSVDCPKCGTSNTVIETLELIKNNHFNK